MRLSFFPRDEQFFELFKQTAAEIRAGAGMLEQMLATDPPDVSKVDLIKDAEHRCDALTHDTIQRLHRTFVTPLDREDLFALATSSQQSVITSSMSYSSFHLMITIGSVSVSNSVRSDS